MNVMQSFKLERFNSRLLLFTILILVVIVSRSLWIDNVNFDSDEIRTAQRAQGNLLEIIVWQPQDWPPLYNVLIGIWGSLTSDHPKILRFSSLLLFLPGIAWTYQFARDFFRNEQAAWGTTFAFATMGYTSFLSGYLRGYILALSLTPLLFLLTIRYFEQRRIPYHGFYLGLTIALIFYSTYAAIALFGMLGMYTIAKYRWQIWKWWLPVSLSFFLVLPDLLYKSRSFAEEVEGFRMQLFRFMPGWSEVLVEKYQQFTGPLWIVWFLLIAIAIVLIFRNERPVKLHNIWIMGSLIIAPLLLYIAYLFFVARFYDVRYIYWGGFFIAMLIGSGLTYLPRPLWYGALGLMLLLSPATQMMRTDSRNIGIEKDFDLFQQNYMPDDVVVLDPAVICQQPDCSVSYKWNYYADVYLGQRLRVVDEPGENRRVWYARIVGSEDLTLQAAARYGRIEVQSIGTPDLMLTLFEGAPDPEGILYENGLRFHGFDILNRDGFAHRDRPELIEQDSVPVRLWWSVDEALTQEYSISLQLIAENGDLLAQVDQAPELIHLNPNNQRPQSLQMVEWQPGHLYYVEERILQLPNLNDPTNAQLYLVVYQWWDNQRLSADGINTDYQLPLTDVLIFGY